MPEPSVGHSACSADDTEMWTPKLGDEVWMNYPDFEEPEGKVVGFVAEGPKVGQPVIERQEDREPVGSMKLGGRKRGEQVVIHSMFLLPFRFGGAEWKQASAEGRIGRDRGRAAY